MVLVITKDGESVVLKLYKSLDDVKEKDYKYVYNGSTVIHVVKNGIEQEETERVSSSIVGVIDFIEALSEDI